MRDTNAVPARRCGAAAPRSSWLADACLRHCSVVLGNDLRALLASPASASAAPDDGADLRASLSRRRPAVGGAARRLIAGALGGAGDGEGAPPAVAAPASRRPAPVAAAAAPAAPRPAPRRGAPAAASTSVATLLASLNLQRFADVFEREEIDGAALALLTDDDLKALGLPLGARRKLMAMVPKAG